ncbi:YceI family protein [Rhodococcoides corynebacterioides]|uniref:YceI family protein n=1 Tax=Rhodococcoides corynebacterioides TaxID=53972 RepID=UPI001C9AC1E4|nr:YceI family protein [Rhodococcus corynebacterioides]MBY6364610.1 YceI family protein [Rhodococcus corynebacterioides]
MTDYTLDPATTQLRFHARGLWGAVPVTGSFGRAEGNLSLRDAAVGTIDIRIDAASIDTGLALRDRHLRAANFLHVERHPVITFRGDVSTTADGFCLNGSLTVRGHEVPHVLEVTTFGNTPDIAGALETTIDLNAFEFAPPFNMTKRDVRLELRGTFRKS